MKCPDCGSKMADRKCECGYVSTAVPFYELGFIPCGHCLGRGMVSVVSPKGKGLSMLCSCENHKKNNLMVNGKKLMKWDSSLKDKGWVSFERPINQKSSPGMSKKALSLISGLLGGTISKDQYRTELFDLANDYPHAGWDRLLTEAMKG